MQNINDVKVFIPTDVEFLQREAKIKKLYEDSQEKIRDTNSYELVRDNTFFYVFFLDEQLVGIIYYFDDNGKLFFNGCSNKKMFPINVECIRLSTTWFSTNIYAEAQNRASALCLIKAGFVRKDSNLFVFESR